MRKRSLLLGLIFLISAFTVQGQIVTKYQQGFEATGETCSYTVTQGTANVVTSVASSGERSLKLNYSTAGMVEIILDTIDFTDNGQFQYFYLEIMHICDVDPLTAQAPNEVATVEVRRPDDPSSDWQVLDAPDYYDVTWGGGSADYSQNASFSERSYSLWRGATPNNTWWKRERFKLNTQLQGATLPMRKLQIRFRLHQKNTSGATTEGWYLDNIKVQCSPNSMLLPVLTMNDYPELMNYPNSRGTHVAATFTTPLTQGMCDDSVYVVYQLGRSADILRKTMTPIAGATGSYETYIPFCGYDTVVWWRIIGKDNSVNHNQANFPMDVNSWNEYRSVRGKASVLPLSVNESPSNAVPFPNLRSYKAEIVYDSAEMSVNYGPAAITQIRYPVAANVTNSNRNRVQIKMRNLDNTFAYTSSSIGASTTQEFFTEFQKIVYDSSLSITQNASTTGIINLQDTFFYAGKGLMVTFTSFNNNGSPSAVSVRTFQVPTSNNSTRGTVMLGYPANVDFDPFTSAYFQSGTRSQQRPNFTFRANENAPLLYDCGISGFINPNDSTPANAVGDNDVVVTLKNYGALPITNVRIYYSVDNGAHQYYDFDGTLAGGATTNVTISTTQQYPAGYHEMLAWVDDSVTSAGMRYRDHEPFNDTLWTRFISCDGPMSGVRQVGGSTPDYANMDKLLYALSQCGVNGPLTVKLAPGYYTPKTFPVIPGTSATNYIQFEPLSGSVTFVSAMADTALVNSLVNLQQANHIRFKNINFFSNAASNPATYLVRMGTNSKGCQFIDCLFSEVQGGTMAESYMAASALLYSGGADSLTVTGCTFNRGTAGLSLVGPAQDNMASGSTVFGNTYTNQGVNSIIVRNQIGTVVDSNTCNRVYANSSYAILLQDCSGATKVTRNTVYVTSGASCIGATNFFGYPNAYAIVANNMLVSDDDGTSNMLTTPLNIITADYAKVLFNSVKLTAPTRNGIAAATFGGGVLSNSYFYNNIVGCYDTVNFAFNFIPTEDSVNYIGYNIYYSRGPLLNKFDGVNCLSFSNWLTHCPTDGNSQNVNPAFLGTSLTDLRSYSQNVKGHAIPFADISTDLFGTERDSVNPCVGAFEFSSLPYDFEIQEFLEPYDEYCSAPSVAPLRVVIKNSGVNPYVPSEQTTPMQLVYSRSTTAGSMAPGVSGSIPVNITIPASDTITWNTGLTIPFPTVGTRDTTYTLYAWLVSSIDPNPANDTSMMRVTSHYHAPAPTNVNVNSNYGAPATVNITQGLQTWYGNVYTSGSSHQSEVYWYSSPESTEPIWRGNTYTTDPLYTDDTLYIRQKRDYGLLKITEVQFKQNQPGVTYPMPMWMNSSTAFAVELTNVGDYPVNLLGDTLRTVSSTTSLNNKIFAFPDMTVQPGQTLVLQYRSGVNNVDSTRTVATATLSPNQNVNIGLLYYHNGVIEDAVAFNDITTNANWTGKNVPNTVWSGDGISLPDSIPTAGVFRTSWPSNATQVTASAPRWQRATNNNRMTLGTVNNNLIRFVDNGCLGDVATVAIHLINLPDVDVAIEDLELTDGCNMGSQPITVTVYNRGSQPSGQIVMNYKVQAHSQYDGQAIDLQLCSDTITAGLAPATSTTHTFSQVPNFSVASASVDFDVMVWVVKNNSDNTTFNDTLFLDVTSMFTPETVAVKTYDTVSYDGVMHLTSLTTPIDSLAWYDRNMMPLDTVNTYVTNHMYEDDTFYVSAFGARINQYHVGTLNSLSSANGYPSPYNPNKKYVKEQYLYLASDLIDAGHSAGPILTLSFYLDTIHGAGQFTLTDYTISIGTTSQETFTANGNWQPVTQYFSADSITLTNSQKGWIYHTLDSAFHWNGTDNIVVQITRTCDPNMTAGARTRYTSGGNNKVLYKNDNNNSVVDFSGNGSRSANRPDIRFGFVDYGCEGPTSPIYVKIVDIPVADASLSFQSDGTGTTGTAFTSCDTTDINVVLRNMGGEAFSTFQIDYWIDTLHGVYQGNTSLQPRTDATLTIARHLFTPGRHVLRAAVTLSGDTVQSNDTIVRMVNVRFCAGHYPVGPNGLYEDFITAIDTLNHAGVDGAVVFDVEPGTYIEQVTIGAIDGASATNTVTFSGVQGSPDSVVLRYAPTNADNYVLKVEDAQFVNFEHITFLARGSGNYSNAVVVNNSNQVRFEYDMFRVKGGLSNVNASCFVVGDGVTALYVNNSILDSGYYSLRSQVTQLGSSAGIYLTGNTFRNFTNTGVYVRKCDDVYLTANQVLSAASSNGKALTGIVVAEHNGPTTIVKNNVVLSDNFNGGKQGIKLIDVNGSNATRSLIANNMCAMYGTRSTGLTSAGIWVDSSTFMNVFFNTCNVYAGNDAQGAGTRSMYVGSTSMYVYIMNNIFQNLSAGWAYYVMNPMNVENSNYNNYYSTAEDRLAWWGVDRPTMDSLRLTNQMDAQSMNERAYFVSNQDLHLTLGTFCERAQYNTAVPVDIDDEIRPQIPPPTMGADEFFRKNHNIAVVNISKPKIKSYPTQTRGFTDNVESDTLWVVVEFMNDGTSTESNLSWWAEIKNSSPALSSTQRVIDELLPQATTIDSNYIAMPIGVIDTQIVVVHFPMSNDSVPSNNDMEQVFFLDPAYNFLAEQVLILDTGCRLQSTPVGVKLKNVGRKAYPGGWQVPVGFQAVLQTPNVVVSTLPVQWTETLTLPNDVDTNTSVTLNFSTPANLYPTGIDKDIVVRARAWVSHQYDQKPLNDTTNFVNHNSYYTPNMPVGIDLQIPYATWDTIFASQTDLPPGASAIHRPIRWHIDSTGTPADEPFYAPSNYAASCWWETPQYFRDTVYYLSCLSAHGSNAALTCTSYYNPVHVNINPRVPVDMAVLDVVEPVGNRVYMTRDSVKIALINYGTQTINNIPVVYQLYDHTNTLLQEVHETCSHSVAPDEVYVYSFDSLLSIPAWSATNAYHLRVWTDMPNENVRLNDTLRNFSYFYAIPDVQYDAVTLESTHGMDITRVAFSSLNNESNYAGHNYLNFVNATRQHGAISTPQTIDTVVLKDYGGSVSPQAIGELRALHLVKGTTDTMIVESVNGDKPDDHDTKGWLTVWIDVDRDGTFSYNPINPNTDSADYSYPNTEIFHHDTIYSGRPCKFLFTLPDEIRTGYMRMRVMVEQGARFPSEPTADFQFGSVQDYLLYIEDEPESIDLCASRIVSPTDKFIGGHTGYGSDTMNVSVKFQIANKGSQPISAVDVTYIYYDRNGMDSAALQWTGTLLRGQSAVVDLPARIFAAGLTNLTIIAKAYGDTITFNDTLTYQYYRAPIKTLIWSDDFEGNDEWFVPRGSNVFTQNLWQRGRSHKPNIMACVSDSSIFTTNINGVVNAFTTGNVSYAYTPIFDISVIRPDTLELWVARGMTTGHLMRIEYFNYERNWVIVGSANDTLWYNSGRGWDTVSSGYGYTLYRFPLSNIGSDFLQRLQFRLVYKAEVATGSCDGVAVDNFVIGRMKRPIDLSVISITYPISPRFGEVINPKVIIKNNGTDTMNNFMLAYRPYGVHLAITGTYSSETGIYPGQTALYEFPTPFTIMEDFPDTFQICAFTTVQMDMYRDNDTVCQDFYLSPMENDMGSVTFLSPLDHIVAGDSVEVTLRIRNYGQGSVGSCRLTYIYNDNFEVNETLNFTEALGHELGTFEFYNYTFRQKFRASMGMMNLMAYVKMDGDDYPFNDTISKRIQGLSAITDLRAREIVVDSSDHNAYYMQVVIDNVGARAANDFRIGYWYYNDISTYREVVYHGDTPLPALETLYYVFPDTLPNQLALYSRVTAFVYADDDNDRSNDTTTTIAEQYVDLRPIRVLVEENRYDSCHVRMEIENIGNVVTNPTRPINLMAVINGTTIRKNSNFVSIMPGQKIYIDFTKTVPKSPTRTYVGTGQILGVSDDHNPDNDMTNRIEVVNYLDLPVVEESNGIVLEQNYPNPWNGSTRIDFFLPTGGEVRFFVMDELGRLVHQSVKEYGAGDQSINFTPRNMNSGVYYYGIEVNGEKLMRKMVMKK